MRYACMQAGEEVLLTSGRKWLTQVIVCNVSQSCCRLGSWVLAATRTLPHHVRIIFVHDDQLRQDLIMVLD